MKLIARTAFVIVAIALAAPRAQEPPANVEPLHFHHVHLNSTDPAKAVEEGMAWADLCRQTNGFGKIHYRRRKLPLNRKSGNIADFCRRWSHRYRYMVGPGC